MLLTATATAPNAYFVNLPREFDFLAHFTGQELLILFENANTSTATINFISANGIPLGEVELIKGEVTPLVSGDIAADSFQQLIFKDGKFRAVFVGTGVGGGVQSVTGNIVDNGDPLNPIVTGVYIKDANNNIFAVANGGNTFGDNCTFNKFEGLSENNQLGDICNRNKFEASASINVLGNGCNDNIFWQFSQYNTFGYSCNHCSIGAASSYITLGNECSNVTFEAGVNGIIFGNNLYFITIKRGTLAADYTNIDPADPLNYIFLYNNPYPSEIFYDGFFNFHKYYDVANDRIVLTNLATLAVSYIGGGAGGTVTNVSGTADRITVATGTTTPVIDISATFEALLEKVANKATDFSVVNNTLYPTVQAAKNYADGLVVGLIDDRGNHDASGNAYPSTGGSGTAGAILKGDLWFISVAGALNGKTVEVGDSVRALVDTPGQDNTKWNVLETNIGYVPAPLRPTATKVTLVDADETTGNDSAASFGQIKTTWTNVKAFLKTYFDSLYPSGSGTSTGTNTGDETTATIQTKRPLKTIEGQSLEGAGNIDLVKGDVGLGNVDDTSDSTKNSATATLTNKTITAYIDFGKKVVALTDATTITTDAALGNILTVTLAGNRTLAAPTNATNGQLIMYQIKQDATGSRTLAYASGAGAFAFTADITSPTLSTGASKLDFLLFQYRSTEDRWFCLAVNKGAN